MIRDTAAKNNFSHEIPHQRAHHK